MRAVGIIMAGGNNKRMQELSQRRAVGAMPIAGNYRAIDFALSNMTNSHIQRVAVLTQYNAWSLNEHLSSSKWWDFGRKQGGLFVFTPSITSDNGFWYRGTADALAQNVAFLKKCHEPYIVIASADAIYKMDYVKVIEKHVETGADITIVCKKVDETIDVSSYGAVKTDKNGRIKEFAEKPPVSDADLISTGIYVARRRPFIQMIEEAAAEDKYDFVSDIIMRSLKTKKIYAYVTEDYWRNISTIERFYDTNMDFLKPEIRNYFFREYPDIYSKVRDLPPAKYNPGSNVKNSLVSSGCIVNGTIEDSVVFKQTYIGNGSYIKNCIVLDDVYIGDGAHLENCIIESHSTINTNDKFVGEGEPLIVNEKNFRYNI